MTLDLHFVDCPAIRDQRKKAHRFRRMSSRLLQIYFQGWETLEGKSVLEIGGLDLNHIENFVDRFGGKYTGVTLNEGYSPNVTGHTDVMDFNHEPFGLVVGFQVFEQPPLGRPYGHFFSAARVVHEPEAYLQRLYDLTQPGGVVILTGGTENVLFSSTQLQENGFDVLARAQKGTLNVGYERSIVPLPQEIVTLRRQG